MSFDFDVIIIGGGAAGMMSAGTAAARGKKVLLLEKNPELGRKLRISGGGRCNITNATFDTRTLLTRYGTADKFLFSPFSVYGVKETLDFFHKKDLLTKVEAESRVFPVSEKAEDVARTLENYIATTNVTIRKNCSVTGLMTEKGKVIGVETKQGNYFAKSVILATGGTSRPDTGSTGDGYAWLSTIGHSVTTPTPTLVPIALKEKWVASVSGLTLPKATISVYQNQTLITKTVGKVLFTHTGLSGPGILNLSNLIADTLPHGEMKLRLNVTEGQNEEVLLEAFKASCLETPNKKIKNVLPLFVPSGLVPAVLENTNLDAERLLNSITRSERHALISNMRGLEVTISHLLGSDKAIVANGGVALTEVDFKTMSSKLYKNLFIVGDMLDIKRPSGGYSLQLCWTTGYIAGSNC